ncbi:MAG: hypothetical protein M0R39_14760 [Prolixibacteraceae bacterium]|nr:hypothetical protein [Prolixibacteraceae bacterium]
MKKIKLISCFLIILFIALSGFNPSDIPVNNEVIQLGSKREIFVDHYLIDKLEGIHITMHTPHDEGIVMHFDKPWEGKFCAYVTIIKDTELYRAYYRGGDLTCYAESKDGINWVKPALRLFEVNGSFKNNVILATGSATHNFTPFLDTNPDARSDQKYKALGGIFETGLIPFISPDGIHWEKLEDEGVIKKGAFTWGFDSQNCAFWSESEQLYICYFRITTEKGFRSVSRTTSSDFINWTESVEMTYGNTPTEHIYIQQTSPYFRAQHIYIAIGARFMQGRQVLTNEQAIKLNVDPTHFKDISDAFFMTTRGGNVYDRTFMESFIRPGIGLSNWVSRTNYPALNVVQTGPAEMSIYVVQDYAQPTEHLRRYSLRLDGFTSISAPFKGGEVITKPFIFSGNELEINYSTSAAGEIRIEIQDENGKPIPGYTMEESQTLIGNEIERIVAWNGNRKVKELASKPVRLRIYMKDADLYSIRFK